MRGRKPPSGLLRIVDELSEDYPYPAATFHVLSDEINTVLAQNLARLAAE